MRLKAVQDNLKNSQAPSTQNAMIDLNFQLMRPVEHIMMRRLITYFFFAKWFKLQFYAYY